mgnify:CR=1 FL=1
MTRSQIDRRIHVEEAREGLLGPWLAHVMAKNKRALRLSFR